MAAKLKIEKRGDEIIPLEMHFFVDSLLLVTQIIDGRRTLTHDKSSHGLWPGELKIWAGVPPLM
jgi:hypothetical protein